MEIISIIFSAIVGLIAYFIYIFQVRKDGAFRGENSYTHDVDVIAELPEKGHTVQNGRFNQGGGLQIFNS